MFTGIIKAKGCIDRIETRGGDKRLTIVSPDIAWKEFVIGESISVNGICLTAVRLRLKKVDHQKGEKKVDFGKWKT